MREKQKQEILQILNTFEEAHDEIQQLCREKNHEAVQSLFIQLQESAIAVGTVVEESEGERCETIHHLEEYCEFLYQMSIETFEKTLDVTVMISKLQRQIDRTISSMEKLAEKRYTIVFLPYKVSMWDCMESIWLAAKEDATCDCYVIPIPYFERRNQGEEMEIQYEGGQMPDYVPVTSYQECDLKIMHPNVIYFHNPYDDYNLVTMVHPDYFSRTLKQYTDMLVYVPYFFNGGENMPETHLNLPAYPYMDRMIVEGEGQAKALRTYIPEEKLVVLGSPKKDRLITFQQERESVIQTRIPKEWRRKIRGKRVFFFNISLTGILENREAAMGKIRYILSRFHQRKDVVLLWRPHPLLEATLQSMLPEWYQEYMQIKKGFLAQGEGILDEQPDTTISVVISDAYIGEDTSSIVEYFRVIRKPIYIMDWDITEEVSEDERRNLTFADCIQEGDSIYFTPRNYSREHLLCQMNLNTGRIDIVAQMLGEPQNPVERYSYCDMVKVKDQIILAPYNARDIYVYNCRDGRAVKLLLQQRYSMGMFDKTVEYQGSLFLKPETYKAIVKLDLETLEIVEYTDCMIPFVQESSTDPMFFWAVTVKGNLMYLASAQDGRMLIFNMDNGESTIKIIGEYPFGFSSMVYDGTDFWLAAWKQSIVVRWNEAEERSEIYEYALKNPENMKRNYAMIVQAEGRMLVYTTVQGEIITIEKDTGVIGILHPKVFPSQTKQESTVKRDDIGYACAKNLLDGRVLAFDLYDNSVRIFHIKKKEQHRYVSCMERKVMLEVEKQNIQTTCAYSYVPNFFSEKKIGLTQFVDYMMEGQGKEQETNVLMTEDVGRRVHQTILKFTEQT